MAHWNKTTRSRNDRRSESDITRTLRVISATSASSAVDNPPLKNADEFPLPTPAPPLVRPLPARSALARRSAESVSRSRQRSHAPADAGSDGCALFPSLHGKVSDY